MASDGVLFVVGTPIGNLDDLTSRAVSTLADADVVLCEDTRRTGRLLQAAGVKARRLVAVHEHNEDAQAASVVDRLRGGARVALVSDAGMPGVSDPGYRLVRAVVAEGLDVRVVPGPSASLAALVISGLPTDRFVFEGFLPRRGTDRSGRLAALAGDERTIVLFEAPHRLARTLDDLAASFGATRAVALCRELTKLHEEVWRGSLAGAVVHVADVEPRGEYVVVVAGAEPRPQAGDDELRAALHRLVGDGMTTRDAVAEVASAHDVSKRRVYALATAMVDKSPG